MLLPAAADDDSALDGIVELLVEGKGSVQFTSLRETRILCVQVRTRPFRDGLNAVLRGLLII